MSFNNWKKYKIGDIVDFHNTKRVALNSREREIRKGNCPYYGASGIVDYLSDYTFDGEYVLISEDGENLRTRKTPIVFIVNGKFRVNNHAHIVQGKQDFINKWLVYFFQNLDINPFITGAVQPKLNKENLQLIEISIPEINTAKKIISILSSIDDKIELNRQTNITLETIAQTLFKEMCLPKSEELPNGWSIEKLENLIETVSVTHKMKQEEIIFLNTSDILEGNVLNNEYSVVSTLPGQAKKSIKRNDILFSEIRPANKRYAFVNFDAEDYVVSTKLMVLRSKGINPYLIYCFLINNDILKELQHLAETRSGTFPQITFTQLKDFKLVIPDEITLTKVSKNIQDIYENIFLNSKEIETLIALRDSLLPKLMKGEIAL